MTDTDDVVDVAEGEFEEFVSKDAPSIREAKQAMVRKDGPQAHGPRM